MTIAEKLRLMAEMERRNRERAAALDCTVDRLVGREERSDGTERNEA